MAREPYADIDDVAAYYRVSKQTIYNWRTRGYGPRAIKIGGRLRWTWREVESFEEPDGRAA